jgi:hypothetical protein
MVYDRQRKGPALVGTNPAVNLTKEQANHIERTLVAMPEGKHDPRVARRPRKKNS